jgi:hypothetical protein
MKSENTIIKNLFRYGGGLAALFFMANTEIAAQAIPEKDNPPMYVTFLLEQDGFLVFRAVINSSSEKKAILKITDGSRALMYSEIIQKPGYARIFKFPKEDEGEIQFQLTTGKETVRKSFSIAATTEEVYVVKEKN